MHRVHSHVTLELHKGTRTGQVVCQDLYNV